MGWVFALKAPGWLTEEHQRVVVVGGSVSAHEIVHEILPFAKGPVYASLRGEPIPSFGWAPFRHPHIEVKKAIERVDPETGRVHFVDGTVLEDVDHIIYATGYTFSLPYLPHVQERIKTAYRRLPGVYQHTFDILDPTLTFVGMVKVHFFFLLGTLLTGIAWRRLHFPCLRVASSGCCSSACRTRSTATFHCGTTSLGDTESSFEGRGQGLLLHRSRLSAIL